MSGPAGHRPAEPARCAGLRQALLHGWTRGFPLRESPFQVLASRLGGTVREVLGHCQVLSDAGALDAIRVHWSPTLERVHWRCGMVSGGPPGRELRAALAALPGVTRVDWVEPDHRPRQLGHAREPTLWFDLVARNTASAAAQRARFEATHGPLLCLRLDPTGGASGSASRSASGDAPVGLSGGTPAVSPGPAHASTDGGDCLCHVAGGPCADPDLARLCEAGLPLRAHPFRSLSDAVHRSERDVLCTLRHWQRAGLLDDLGLGVPPDLHESLWTVVAIADAADPDGGTEGRVSTPAPFDAGVRAALLARPGVGEVLALPGDPRWPWRLQVGAVGASAQTEALLLRALVACGLGGHPRRMMRVHRLRLRAAPLLFAEAGAVADA